MENWQNKKLSEICTLKYGKDHKKLRDGNIPVYGSGGIMRYVENEIHNKKSVLIPRKGTLSNLFLAKPPFWTVDTIFWTDIDSGLITAEFLYYNLHTKNLAELNVGTAVPSLTTAVLNEVRILLPPIVEQKAIADTLSCFDDKIELNNKINKNLEAQAQAIFKSWFVDFEPFQDGEFEDSELGRIPKGWRVGMLGEVAKSIDNRGKTPPLSKIKTNYPIIDVKALSGQTRIVDYNNCKKYVEKNTYETWFRSGHPQYLDILISTVGSLAELKLFLGNIGCIAQNVVGLRCLQISSLYIYQYLQFIKQDLIAYNIGSVQPSIKVTHIIKQKLLIPQESILNNFDDLLKNITEKIFVNNQQTQTLTTIRETLLPKLMSGEVRVSIKEIK